MKNSVFNIRVYGILIHENKLLVTDEEHAGISLTKLPGGGLEFGEGTIECLIREFKEELDLDIRVSGHFYTTDFFQTSAFNPAQQVISIYYRVEPVKPGFSVLNESLITRFPAKNPQFRWIPLHEIEPKHFTLPIDQAVAGMLNAITED
jgi:8-oxo-dGTP diphosphatase